MATYVPLQSLTLTSNTTTVTFTNINQSYTDLRLVMRPASSSGTNGIRIRLGNGGTADSGSNYSYTAMDGNGSTAGAYRESGVANATLGYRMAIQTGFTQVYTVDFLNYTNSTTFKTVLFRYNDASVASGAGVFTWRSTSAVDTLSFNINTFGSSTGDFIVGSTFDLYGISPTNAKVTSASGGTAIYYDSTYAYHVFTGTGTFTPTRSLTADILVVAGGGGGGNFGGGGGGAGGLLAHTSQSLTATSYTVTVGAGGTGGAANSGVYGVAGTNSQFASLTASVGGGRGGGRSTSYTASVGGSGGGNAYSLGSVAGTSGQGFAGGGGTSQGGGGGGGAGEAGNTDAGQGDGGDGSSSYSSWGAATNSGELVSGSYYYAGGGGGFGDNGVGGAGGSGGGGSGTSSISTRYNGLTNTGGGGGATSQAIAGGAGGSGIVIVRYER